MVTAKVKTRIKRKRRVRGKISGTAERPRLSVFRSNTNIYAQVINDTDSTVLVTASTIDKDLKAKFRNINNLDAAKAVGEKIAEKAVKKGIKEAVFDRNGYLYHGRIKALADAAREKGLKI